MRVIERAIYLINTSALASNSESKGIDTRIRLITTLCFIIVALSMPMVDPASLLWLFCFPIFSAEASGIGYAKIFKRSLWVLPLVIFIGIFNPILDHKVIYTFGNFAITQGWLTFFSLILRALLTMQALLLLIADCGYYEICRSLRYFRVPGVMVTQLLILYRYISVILSETLSMQRSMSSRGYGRKSYPLRMWGMLAGQLLMRSVARARHIDAAMRARCYTGVIYFKPYCQRLSTIDFVYLGIWISIFLVLRFVNLTAFSAHLLIS